MQGAMQFRKLEIPRLGAVWPPFMIGLGLVATLAWTGFLVSVVGRVVLPLF
jgi:hypothetical protein